MSTRCYLRPITALLFARLIWPTFCAATECRIRPENREVVQYLGDSLMYIYEIEIYNKTHNPLYSDITHTYKPWKWYRPTSDHGKTLLTLSFNYDVLSLNILTIGVETIPLKIKDIPVGCFRNLTAEERTDMIRDKVFDNFKRKRIRKPTNEGEDGDGVIIDDENKPEVIYVCNEVIREKNGYAVFANRCCQRDSEGNITCSEQEDNFWITVLYICIGLVKIMMFMFGPLLVPSYMYTASYVASEYVVKLTKELKFKIFVSESKTTSVRAKHTLKYDQITEWHRFRKSIEDLEHDKICHVKVPELRIKVKGKRIIPSNEPPTGLLRTIYDNLIRCKIRRLDPFKDCCNMSVYSPRFEPLIKHRCTWEDLTLVFIKLVMLLLLPVPFYLRMFIYYRYEEEELGARKAILKELDLKEAFHPFRMTFIQYFSPTHGIFIAAYSFYIVSGIVIGFLPDDFRNKLKSIVRSAFHDMQNVSRTSVLQEVLGVLLWPFRRLGLLALISCPLISIVTAPVWCLVFVLYCIPTVYLAHRLVYHAKKRLGSDNSFFESDKPLRKATRMVHKVHKKLVNIDKSVHIARQIFDEEEQSPCVTGFGRLAALRRFLLQVLVSIFCLIVLFSAILLFVEAVGLIIEVLVFTMMGIIVNAGSTLRYVSMALLVIVYMHNCYDNVYDNYLTFNNTVIEDVMDKVEDLKKVASLPSSMQENAAFQVKPVEAVDEIPTTLYLDKKEPQWKIGHLLLFLDSNDTPRIPLNLFRKLCEVRVHGAPGPVYINLLKATAKFSIIVVFLFFVMVVVMAFGSAHQMSSTNQTLATLAGGFVPMLLKNVLSSKGTKLNLKTLSFKGQIDEIVAEYKQGWPIYDMVIEAFDPEAEAKEKEAKEKETGENNDKDKDGAPTVETKPDTDVILNPLLEKKKSELQDNGSVSNSMSNLLKPPDPFSTSDEDLRPVGTRKPEYMRRLSICALEDNNVDLFIDLHVPEDEAAWRMSGSLDSLQSLAMYREPAVKRVDERMPYDPGSVDGLNYVG